ncbi:hypothetical protein [Nocardiopsis sp. FIRDI 009]|uniref:hypothetical protein n=1 Tax=Nocardiopsis sp. FIRDI 009 TaxID=714197 RepID=UPI000E28657D|nr:hypothetical protein [Nocardiopsis sp. FIRDI 009]
MPFRIATEPGRPDRPNEDFAAVSADCAVLLDGVTARPDDGCRHGVAWFTRSLGGLLLAGADAGLDLREALAEAIGGVASLHGGTCDLARRQTPSATVVAVRVRGAALEYLVLSDAVLLVRGQDGARLIADTRLDDLRGRVAGPVRAYRNVPGGFWTAGADPRAADEAVAGTLPHGPFAALTDGAGRGVEVFRAHGWGEALDLALEQGPGALVARVRALERADPEGARHPRGKVHDDATVVTWTP